jgi:CheY-like chemotaxis protein
MLTFSRGKRGESRPIDPVPLVKETVKLFGSTFPSSIQLRLELEADIPRVMADPIQFEQVLVNLCINARDAIENRGQILILLRSQEETRAVCSSCRQSVTGTFVELAVHDDGSGIPAEHLDRIFEPFYTTKPVGEGSGMGLATTHGIVHEHHGHIVIESPPEGGTLFRVLMQPAIASSIDGHDDNLQANDNTQEQVGHILLVEDEESVRSFMHEFLESRGFSVSEAVDGIDALEWLDNTASTPDLIITDQTMPRMTGLELAHVLAERRLKVPALLYTGYGDQLSDAALAEAGLAGWLKKPVDPGELLAQIKRAMQG